MQEKVFLTSSLPIFAAWSVVQIFMKEFTLWFTLKWDGFSNGVWWNRCVVGCMAVEGSIVGLLFCIQCNTGRIND